MDVRTDVRRAEDFDGWLAARLAGTGAGADLWAHGQQAVTRAELGEQTARMGEVLGAHGIGRGSTVAVQLPPGFTLLWSVFALWGAGAQVMLLDPRLTGTETTRLLEVCEPQFHLSSGEGPLRVVSFRDECEVVVTPRPGGLAARTPHRLVQFSSGSTGLPKVIGRTGPSLLAEIDRFARLPGMPRRGEGVLLLSSLVHSFGLIGGVLHALGSGAALHFPRRPHRRELHQLLVERRLAAVFGVPAHFDLLARSDGDDVPPALRLAVSGGEILPVEVFERFERRYGVRIGQAYGMSEVGIIAAGLAGAEPPPAVGVPAPGTATTVTGGTLRVRLPESPYLFGDHGDRYADGWLDTRDLCTVAPDTGVLTITGRADSVVAIGGLKVDLTEVEAVLAAHAAVTEAVVVYGEAIEAHLVVSGGARVSSTELLAWCRERLSPHKIPKAFHFPRALPRTSNGKLIRNRELLHAAREAPRQVAFR
ncbi:class I adenylate-forming enzyme family protein [Streptomyces sp. NPDC101165]|uniref:class I adenylate-forming enzyme family protein n=1 Tax=Streptomyces sp. NPDC101165 TaxID=3366119 RepID=UPI0037F3F644